MKLQHIIKTPKFQGKTMQNAPECEETDQYGDVENNSLLPASNYPKAHGPKSELSQINKILIVSVMVVILTIIFSYILISLFPKPYSKLLIGLEKPAFDERKYKAIELPNQMKVLLISDPESEVAGVSIDVGVGSWNEPENLPGLAHFLEHMLFMGSKKYPNVSEFNDFISQNGGSYNAMTSSQNTNYHFTVSDFALEKSLDIFSRFFIDPLLNEETVSKEINAVNSEYTNDLTDPRWKLDISLEMIANKGNPASRFTIGNLKTLRDDPASKNINTYKELQAFHQKFYSSNIMSAVICSKQPIFALEKLIIEKFSEIPNKKMNRREINTFKEPAFNSKNSASFLAYKSSMSEKSLEIGFAIDSNLDDFKRKPLIYLGNLINNESPSGFSVMMKEAGLVTSIQSGIQSENLNFSFFVIQVGLTDQGYNQIEEVLKNVFAYLRKVEREGISKERFDEFKKIFAFNFLYKEKNKDLMSEIRDLAFVLNTYPAENVLNSEFIVEDYDEDLYKKVISSFTPENSFIILGDKDLSYENGSLSVKTDDGSTSFFNNLTLTEFSDIYKFAYSIKRIPDSLLASLSNATSSLLSQVSLPEKNRFLPEDFINSNDQTLKKIFASNGEVKLKGSLNKKMWKSDKIFDPTPTLLINNDKFNFWHKTDETFKLPIYVIKMSLDSPLTHLSAKNTLLMMIFIEYLSQETAKSLFDALNLGYKIDFSNNGKGLEISIKGYSDKTDRALLETLTLIKSSWVDQKKFSFLLNIVLQNLRNDLTEAAFKHGKNIMKKILRKYYDTPPEVEKASQNITLTEFLSFLQDLKSKLFVEGLIYGNVQENTTVALAENMSQILEFTPADKNQLMREEILNLKDQDYQFREFNENPEDQNNLLMNYYQYGPYTFNASFLLNLINDKLANDAFNYLRGELQLGYLVTSAKINLYGVIGVVIVVQGSVADPMKMNQKAEEFMQIFSESFMNMTNDEFESIRESNIKILQEGEKEIQERANFVWDEIRTQFLDFDKRNKAIAFLQSLRKEDLIGFYKSFIKENIGKLSIQLYSQTVFKRIDSKPDEIGKNFIRVNGSPHVLVENLDGFKGVPRYPVQIYQSALNYESNEGVDE